MRAYNVVMEAVAALLLVGLAGWLVRTAWRAPRGPFRAVSLGGAGICLLLGGTSLHRLLLIAADGGVAPSRWRDLIVGPVGTVLATIAVAVGVWAAFLAFRYWKNLGRAQWMVDVLTDRVPSEAQIKRANLSIREQEVLDLIQQGILRDEDLARSLHISPATAATHVQNILRKTGLHNRRDLMLLPGAITAAIRSKGA